MNVQSAENKSKNNAQRLDLSRIFYYFLKALKRIWWLIPALAILLGVFGGVRAKISYTPVYQASASYTVEIDGLYGSYYGKATARQLAASFPHILTTGELTSLVCKDLGVSTLPGTVSVSVLENTNLLTVTARSQNAEDAYRILCSVVENYPAIAEYVVGKTTLKLVISPIMPTEPINQEDVWGGVKKWAVIGAVVGFLLIVAKALLSSTVVSSEDVEKKLNISDCSVLPMVRRTRKMQDSALCIKDQAMNAGFYESISSMRNTVVHQARKNGIKTIMITSTVPGEGKTTVAANLALSLSNHSYRVLLIDCDLRNPSLMPILGYSECKVPFSEVIRGNAEVSDALIHENNYLDVLMEDRFNSDASELVASHFIEKLLNDLRDQYDYIIVDTPPCGLVSESLSLAEQMDGLLYVIRQDYVRTSHIIDALDRYADSGICQMGCVLNMAKHHFAAGSKGYGYGSYSQYGYGYGYGYGSKQDKSHE